ncbi:MAG: hypothetical protein ACYC9Q_04985 [Bacillota bacterium]
MEPVDEAISHLEEVAANLQGQKSGEYLLKALENYIRRHEGEPRRALELALGVWFDGPDLTRCVWAEDLIVQLQLVQYLPALRRRRNEVLSSNSRFPRYWLKSIEQSIESLESVAETCGERPEQGR